MDDSDEYFDDSFSLDDEALASIQETEARFVTTISQSQAPPPVQPPQPSSRNYEALPPTKRLKTSHEGEVELPAESLPANNATLRTGAGPAVMRRKMESMEYDLDIRVGPDGKYIISREGVDNKESESSAGRNASGSSTSKLLAETSIQTPRDRPIYHGKDKAGPSNNSTPHTHYAVVSQLTHIPAVAQKSLDTRLSAQQTPSNSRAFVKSRSGPVDLARSSNNNMPASQEVGRLVPAAPVAAHRRQLVRRATAVVSSEHLNEPTPSQRRTRLIEQALAAESSTQTEGSTSVPSVKSDTPRAHVKPADFQAELALLRAELEKMTAVNTNIQKSLREAQEAQLVRAGEVTILRQTIEKTKTEYAEVVAKAKADRLAAEKIKADLESKFKEEAERMATRLIFKQHEIETSTRKPVWGSVRSSRRVVKDNGGAFNAAAAAETPTRNLPFPPSTIKRNSQLSPAKKGQSDHVLRENLRTTLSSPTSQRKSVQTRDEPKKLQFKGFHNAFADTQPAIESPTRAKRLNHKQQHRGSDPLFYIPEDGMGSDDQVQDVHWPVTDKKGKGKAVETKMEMNLSPRRHNLDSALFSSPNRDMMDDEDGLANNGMYVQSVERLEDEEMVEQGIDWGEELRRLVFTHKAPRQDVLTLQMLLSTVLPQETSSHVGHTYTVACQTILEMCGANHGPTYHFENSEWEEEVVDKVAAAFVTVADVLCIAGCIIPLTALLDLLSLLTLCIPAFLSHFLGPAAASGILDRPPDREGPSQLLTVLCNAVKMHLAYVKDGVPNGPSDPLKKLATAVVELMESLCWNVKDGLIEQLGIIPRPAVLDVLLHPGQPTELIRRTLRLLALLASHKNLFRYLLATADTDSVESITSNMESTLRIPIIEKLSHFLVEPVSEEMYKTYLLVFILIGLLADSHNDGPTLLLESISLAPSLVVCIAGLSRLLWEDDPIVMESPESAKTTVELLFIAVNLLHHLTFTLETSSVLGRKLLEASRLSGPFNGVTHMFIVSFGRLTWAEAPEWLEDECKNICEIVAELALEIIETVVAGPECDSLWAVWHQDEILDGDEEEAQKIMVD